MLPTAVNSCIYPVSSVTANLGVIMSSFERDTKNRLGLASVLTTGWSNGAFTCPLV